jgi:hypothetical protein
VTSSQNLAKPPDPSPPAPTSPTPPALQPGASRRPPPDLARSRVIPRLPSKPGGDEHRKLPGQPPRPCEPKLAARHWPYLPLRTGYETAPPRDGLERRETFSMRFRGASRPSARLGTVPTPRRHTPAPDDMARLTRTPPPRSPNSTGTSGSPSSRPGGDLQLPGSRTAAPPQPLHKRSGIGCASRRPSVPDAFSSLEALPQRVRAAQKVTRFDALRTSGEVPPRSLRARSQNTELCASRRWASGQYPQVLVSLLPGGSRPPRSFGTPGHCSALERRSLYVRPLR